MCVRAAGVILSRAARTLHMSRDTDTSRTIRLLAKKLRFPVSDVDAANATYAEYRRTGDPKAWAQVEIWAYLYVFEYFTAKLILRKGLQSNAFEELRDAALMGFYEKHTAIRDPDRFAYWLSVVCKNVFFSHLRAVTPIWDTQAEVGHFFEDHATSLDHALCKSILSRAVEALPEYLKPVAIMRFLEERSYDYISAHTSHPMATVRSYIHRSKRLLWKHPDVQRVRKEFSE
ncbi:sigma-70 family RNA polymerase sigma factor [soil metagenome]